MNQGFESLDTFMRQVRPLLTGDVTEVCINRPGEAWTESFGGWTCHDLPNMDYAALRTLAKLIAHSSKQAINEQSPVASVALPSHERVQIIVPPACESGTVSLTIRKPGEHRFTMDDYDEAGFFDEIVVQDNRLRDYEEKLLDLLDRRLFRQFFELAVLKKMTMLVSGATGSGKTTFMKTLVDCVPHDERIITIEDTPELTIRQPNHVRLFYSKGGQGQTALTAGDLVQACMRMKPDRIFPAELRDEAAYHFLLAANTGHPGSITSIHANNEVEAIPRMADLAAEAPAARTTTKEALVRRIYDTIDVVAHIGKVNGKRRITGIYYDPNKKRAAMG